MIGLEQVLAKIQIRGDLALSELGDPREFLSELAEDFHIATPALLGLRALLRGEDEVHVAVGLGQLVAGDGDLRLLLDHIILDRFGLAEGRPARPCWSPFSLFRRMARLLR